eukprot:946837-Rhodomonas_salina.1
MSGIFLCQIHYPPTRSLCHIQYLRNPEGEAQVCPPTSLPAAYAMSGIFLCHIHYPLPAPYAISGIVLRAPSCTHAVGSA